MHAPADVSAVELSGDDLNFRRVVKLFTPDVAVHPTGDTAFAVVPCTICDRICGHCSCRIPHGGPFWQRFDERQAPRGDTRRRVRPGPRSFRKRRVPDYRCPAPTARSGCLYRPADVSCGPHRCAWPLVLHSVDFPGHQPAHEGAAH